MFSVIRFNFDQPVLLRKYILQVVHGGFCYEFSLFVLEDSFLTIEHMFVVWFVGLLCIARERKIMCDLKVMYMWLGVAVKRVCSNLKNFR